MTADLTAGYRSNFDAMRRDDVRGEYWTARDLMVALGYDKWERFEDAVERARSAIGNTGMRADEHASRLREASGQTTRINYRLTRYGAYMLAMNGDPRKSAVAAAQSYFAVQTHVAETAVAIPTSVGPDLLRQIAAAMEAKDARIAELEPAAAVAEAIATATGDMSVREAAQTLARDHGIDTGQKRLFSKLRDLGWIDAQGRAYQAQLKMGRLSVRTFTYDHPHTGEPMLSTQLRVTGKGLTWLHEHWFDAPAGLRALPGGVS